MAERETWTSRVGFIFAAVGSAVGLGNIWQFPFQTAQNGGAAFLIVLLLVVFLIGFPAMLAEFVIGRRTERNAIDAFRSLGSSDWRFIGAIGVFTALVTLAFYSVVGGWVIRYIIASVTGAYFGNAQAYFAAVSSGWAAVGFHALFMAITIGVVAFGVTDGIERSTKIMIPAIIILLVGMGVWAATLPGAAAGYDYYLTPDFGKLFANIGTILPAAVGQAFFTLSLGFGVMIAYASYLGQNDNLLSDGGAIVIINTLVGVLAGFVVFPILFSLGVEPGSGGTGAAFISLAGAFSRLPVGHILGIVFFVVLFFAALSSSISLLEAPVVYVLDNYDYNRGSVATVLGTIIFVIGLPTAFSSNYLTLYNNVVYSLLLPFSVLLVVLFLAWGTQSEAIDELRRGSGVGGVFTRSWVWWLRIVIPIALIATLGLGILSFV
ncbi:MAG TPA: sodium-dependent transporter [Halococcus sp.]|nr:sodium-dependent transporter [Halococcus sp.]